MPRLAQDYYINFYGGEPVLNFDTIEKMVNFLTVEDTERKKRPHFSMTTNGALLSEEKIRFLDKHQFSVELSFDGLAQVIRRDRKSYDKVIQIIARILERQNIRLETNSVFDAWSVSYLSESVASIIGLGVRNISLSLSILTSWDRQSLGKLEQEIANLGQIQLASYQRTGEIRLVDFREDGQKGVFYCAAGRDRFAVSTDGTIWGCPLFADYFAGRENSPQYKEYCFGNLGRPGVKPGNVFSRIRSNYAHLSMDSFSTREMKCFLCPDLENCSICPMNVSIAGHSWEKIPDYVCAIQKIKIRGKEKFSKELHKILNISRFVPTKLNEKSSCMRKK